MLRYRKVYFDLNLKILTIIITQVFFCSVLRLARSIVGCLRDKKNRFVANNSIANDIACFRKRISWYHYIHDESHLFYLPEVF